MGKTRNRGIEKMRKCENPQTRKRACKKTRERYEGRAMRDARCEMCTYVQRPRTRRGGICLIRAVVSLRELSSPASLPCPPSSTSLAHSSCPLFPYASHFPAACVVVAASPSPQPCASSRRLSPPSLPGSSAPHARRIPVVYRASRIVSCAPRVSLGHCSVAVVVAVGPYACWPSRLVVLRAGRLVSSRLVSSCRRLTIAGSCMEIVRSSLLRPPVTGRGRAHAYLYALYRACAVRCAFSVVRGTSLPTAHGGRRAPSLSPS